MPEKDWTVQVVVEAVIALAAHQALNRRDVRGRLADAACDTFGEWCRGRPYSTRCAS